MKRMREERPLMSNGTSCRHLVVNSEKAIWVPGGREIEGAVNPIVKRRYCILCGKIHYVGSHPGKKVNYWIDVISRLSKIMNHLYERRKKISVKMTEAQKRLIINELLEDAEFQDLFSTTFTMQQERVEELLKKYTGISQRELEVVYERLWPS